MASAETLLTGLTLKHLTSWVRDNITSKIYSDRTHPAERDTAVLHVEGPTPLERLQINI